MAERKLKVFLCYAVEDKLAVRELYQRLKSKPWIEPWLDEESLLPGQDFDLQIYKAQRDADAIIICLSQISVAKEGYVNKEIRRALDTADEKPEGAIFIIPLRLDDCKPSFTGLRKLHWVDYFRPETHEKLLDSLLTRAEVLKIDVSAEEKLRQEAKERALKELQKQYEQEAREIIHRELEEQLRKDAEIKARIEIEALVKSHHELEVQGLANKKASAVLLDFWLACRALNKKRAQMIVEKLSSYEFDVAMELFCNPIPPAYFVSKRNFDRFFYDFQIKAHQMTDQDLCESIIAICNAQRGDSLNKLSHRIYFLGNTELTKLETELMNIQSISLEFKKAMMERRKDLGVPFGITGLFYKAR